MSQLLINADLLHKEMLILIYLNKLLWRYLDKKDMTKELWSLVTLKQIHANVKETSFVLNFYSNEI